MAICAEPRVDHAMLAAESARYSAIGPLVMCSLSGREELRSVAAATSGNATCVTTIASASATAAIFDWLYFIRRAPSAYRDWQNVRCWMENGGGRELWLPRSEEHTSELQSRLHL